MPDDSVVTWLASAPWVVEDGVWDDSVLWSDAAFWNDAPIWDEIASGDPTDDL